MASNIDITKPVQGNATTASVRANFAAAKTEIEALQTSAAANTAAATMQTLYPIGSLYLSTLATNPNTLLGFGTWAAFGSGRVLVGQDTGQTEFDVLEETGGEKTHTLTTAELASHNHTQNAHNHTQDAHNHTQNAHAHQEQRFSATNATGNLATGNNPSATPVATGMPSTQNATATNIAATATNQAATATNQAAGSGTAHNNLQPYIVISIWKRTA